MLVARQLVANISCIFILLFQLWLFFFLFVTSIILQEGHVFLWEVVEVWPLHNSSLTFEPFYIKASLFLTQTSLQFPTAISLQVSSLATEPIKQSADVRQTRNAQIKMCWWPWLVLDVLLFTFAIAYLPRITSNMLYIYSDASRCAVVFYHRKAASPPGVVGL